MGLVSITRVRNRLRKGKRVYLSRNLPLGFRNTKPVPAKADGFIDSDGFERGMLRVHFVMLAGDEYASFNELSANRYLKCDWLT